MKQFLRNLAAVTASAITATLVSHKAMAQDVMPGGYGNSGWGYGHMMTGGLMMIVLWGGLIVLVVVLVRWLSSDGIVNRSRDQARSDAIDILRERFARGEIDEEEFHARRKTLESSSRK